MLKGEIIAVGNELLLGSTVNTNAQFLSKELSKIGIDVHYHTVVGDYPDELEEIINISIDRSDIIIFTGGLGPTEDDMTKEIVCNTLKINQVLNEDILDAIEEYFSKTNRKMPNNNTKQAYIPEGSIILKNDIGTAPGFLIKWKKKTIVLLPGPPREMKRMFSKYAKEYLRQEYTINTKTIKTIGIGESALEELLKPIISLHKDLTISTYAKLSQVDIEITGRGYDTKEINKKINKAIENIEERLGEYIYSFNNETIEEALYKILLKKNMKIGFCESCTGGLLASRFTKIPGASKVFDRGIITYSNKAKIEELNVRKETLDKYTAVSKETAKEMAIGLLKKSNIDLAISTTGYAGPNDSYEKVGLVYIGLAKKDSTKVIKCNFSGSRTIIQKRAATKAFDEARKLLLS